VDGVLCRWGYMLMADPEAALAETRRVLRPPGRVVLSVWGPPDRNAWASVPAQALMEHTGQPPPDPGAPGIFALADPERLRALLQGAGLERALLAEVEVVWRFDGLDDYWRFVTELAGGLALTLAEMPEDEQRAVRALVEVGITPYLGDGGLALPGVAINVIAG
jgi:SAM-dependent methyltransferase